MVSLYNLKPEKVIKAFERAGWMNRGFRGSHVKLTKEGNPNILSIPVHKGRSRRNFPTELIVFSEVLRIHLHQFLLGAAFHRITIGEHLDGVYDLSLLEGWLDWEGFSARSHAS